ncbi:dynein axonemal assembly factor 11 isoform X1 [Bombus pyrosoma]|uniref:dynein axonemal assembly factor 11 isoform X1 n=1 Tax=Bombus pyrosoma TaxID=396416 RepID=UPI001CB8A03C|nr:dynein axonemal assembly factor 11 isoform X1 [Bombus pyrosoma]
MSRITLDLLRKRSEHNEGEISTLEEIALHQENIEKIELIDRTCRHLKILLLQNNLISKIENLSKLKRLEYLNLALNNIETIENLQGLESLKKLDLTVNFIGDLRGIKTLRYIYYTYSLYIQSRSIERNCYVNRYAWNHCHRYNERLEQLFLVGNPCADYEGYREYAIAALTRLKELDGTPIDRSERIRALQRYAEIEGEIVRSCARYKKIREAELLDYHEQTAKSRADRKVVDGEEHRHEEEKKERAEKQVNEEEEEEEEEDESFWNRTSRHTPEERVAIAERFMRKEKRRNREKDRSVEPRTTYRLKLFDPQGKPYNVNQPKVPFKLNEEQYSDRIVLEVALYKYLDTCHVDVDVHPEYVSVTIKGKVLQLTLPCEVSVKDSTARRNTTNGRLVVTMPRLNPLPTILPLYKQAIKEEPDRRRTAIVERRSTTSVREYLEIGPSRASDLDFSRIAAEPMVDGQKENRWKPSDEKVCSDDDSEVPPLE